MEYQGTLQGKYIENFNKIIRRVEVRLSGLGGIHDVRSMGPAWIFQWEESVFWGAARKTAYKLRFKTFKTAFTDCPKLFTTGE
jgi:hypothetical protein